MVHFVATEEVTVPDADPRPLTATIEIPTPPEQVWAVVSDVRRTPAWSPECRRVVPLGPAPRPRLLLGLNRRGTSAGRRCHA